MQQFRDEREDREAQAAVLAELAEAGVTVVEHPRWDSPVQSLDQLSTEANPITVESHMSCPGHAAYLAEVWTDVDEDEQVDTNDDEDDGSVLAWEAIYVCTDPVANGHITEQASRRSAASERTEADIEAERQERRNVLANNKAWRSAESVRREWLAKFLERKSAPKDAQRFIYAAITHGDFELTKAMQDGHVFGAELLGIEMDSSGYGINRQPLIDTLNNAIEARAQVMALALVLGAYESQTGVHCWRSAREATRRYMSALASWGYVLSDVENLAAGESGN